MAEKYTFDDLLNNLSTYIIKEESVKKIIKAYEFAKVNHEGQFRKTGDPYIAHPLEVSIILTELKAGPNAIIAGLLHDVVEDCVVTLEEIVEMFGQDVANLVDGVTKISKLKFASLEQEQASNHQKMLLAMAKDIRVVIIKLADRLHNMRTMHVMPEDKQVKKAKETLEIYAPLAHKLGIYKIKAELEDRSLRYIDRQMFNKIKSYIGQMNPTDFPLVDGMIDIITGHLEESRFKDYTISGRLKNVYSIYKKSLSQERDLAEIFDVFAIRIIVDRIDQCYQVLGIIHSHFAPLPKRIKDYIALPKPNMYQSLHTTVVGKDAQIFEVQIRTKEMDKIAEYGVAAHWAYKENVEYSREKEQHEIAQKLKWYGELIKISEESNTTEDYVRLVKTEILDTNVYVYTPDSRVLRLPHGSTPIDFAYRIHSDVGDTMTGAIVNRKIVPLNYILKNGDIVNIRTSKNSFGPSEDWLKIAKSSQAKQKIKTFLNKQNRDTLIERGKEELEKELNDNKFSFDNLTESFIEEHFSKSGANNLNDLFYEIAKDNISVKTVVYKLTGSTLTKEDILQKQITRANRTLSANNTLGVIVEGLSNPQLKLANCCNPIPGDIILGYVSKTSGMVVHNNLCKNLETFDEKRLVKLSWADDINRQYAVKIKLSANQDNKLLGDIMTTVSALNMGISSISATNTHDLETIIKASFLTRNTKELEKLIANLKKITSVRSIEREV